MLLELIQLAVFVDRMIQMNLSMVEQTDIDLWVIPQPIGNSSLLHSAPLYYQKRVDSTCKGKVVL